MREFIIGPQEAGRKVHKYISLVLANSSGSFAYKALRKKTIVVNDKKVDPNYELVVGDCVKMYLSEETFLNLSNKNQATKTLNEEHIYQEFYKYFPCENKSLTIDFVTLFKQIIIFENEHILLMNKPQEMLSQKATESDISLIEYMNLYLTKTSSTKGSVFQSGICNRLDRNTSGIVIGTKSLKGAQLVNSLIKSHNLQKYYYCIVKGRLLEKHIKLRGYLTKNETTNTVSIEKTPLNHEATYIATDYEVLATTDTLSFLKVHLITGKSHQIRAHLASINHPVIGDYKYGNRQQNRIFKEKYGVRNQLLHAVQINFPFIEDSMFHDISTQFFLAEMPYNMKNILQSENLDGNMG